MGRSTRQDIKALDTYIVKRLEQAKLLTDPFKLKLLERFGGDPVTTKQVADRMGEKAPRLYRHVDALFDAGLLELVEEKPKRGTVERYFRTVASRFEIDPDLFSPQSAGDNAGLDVMRQIFRDTESELVALLSATDERLDKGPRPLVMRVAVSGSEADMERLQKKLSEWVEECGDTGEHADGVSYAGLVAFYPRPDEASSDDS